MVRWIGGGVMVLLTRDSASTENYLDRLLMLKDSRGRKSAESEYLSKAVTGVVIGWVKQNRCLPGHLGVNMRPLYRLISSLDNHSPDVLGTVSAVRHSYP